MMFYKLLLVGILLLYKRNKLLFRMCCYRKIIKHSLIIFHISTTRHVPYIGHYHKLKWHQGSLKAIISILTSTGSFSSPHHHYTKINADENNINFVKSAELNSGRVFNTSSPAALSSCSRATHSSCSLSITACCCSFTDTTWGEKTDRESQR